MHQLYTTEMPAQVPGELTVPAVVGSIRFRNGGGPRGDERLQESAPADGKELVA